MIRKMIFYPAAAVAAAAVIAGAGFLKAVFLPGEAQIPEYAHLNAGETIAPGRETSYSLRLSLPVNCRIKNCTLTGKNVVPSPVEKNFSSWKFDRADWEIKGSFRPLEPGKYADAEVLISTVGSGRGTAEYQVKIPEFQCTLPADAAAGGTLLTAPEANIAEDIDAIPFYRKKSFLIISGIILAAAVIAAVLIAIRRKKIPELPLDERCINEIKKLCGDVDKGVLPAEKGWGKLCDIVRIFVEERYRIPASTRTTAEFIREISSGTALLPSEAGVFLTGFMKHADMIKFAGKKSEKEFFEKAAYQAVEMIKNSKTSGEEEAK